jgi:hypothetical protein
MQLRTDKQRTRAKQRRQRTLAMTAGGVLAFAAAAALVRTDLLAAHHAGTAVTGIACAEQFQAARLPAARRGAGRRRR